MSYYVGLDLHGSNTYLGILDEKGERVLKAKVDNFIDLVLDKLELFRSSIAGVVVE